MKSLRSMKTSDLIIQSVLLLQHHRDPRTPAQLQALCDEIDARMPPRDAVPATAEAA